MYGPLWRRLPGPWPVKGFLSLVLVLGVVAVCFLWLFPTIAPIMPFNSNTVGSGPVSPGPSTSAPSTSAP